MISRVENLLTFDFLPTFLFSLFLAYIFYQLIRPEFFVLEQYKQWHEIGYYQNPIDFSAQRQQSHAYELRWQAERLNSFRKSGKCPPVYPNGWYGVMEGSQLLPGQCFPVNIVGLNLVVFREQKGDLAQHPKAHILDSMCPHLGANLAVGGRVHQDKIECPFHGWQFDGSTGNCVKIPYKDQKVSIPSQCHIKSYPSCEVNGWIHIWFDAEGRPPSWHIPLVPQIQLNYWNIRAKVGHEVLAHIQELPENAGDLAHLSEVHETGHTWEASWKPLDPEVEREYEAKQEKLIENRLGKKALKEIRQIEGINSVGELGPAPVGQMCLVHRYKLFGMLVPFSTIKVVARQTGPALVHLLYESSLFGQGAFMQYVTPIEPLKQRLVHHTWAQKSIPSFLSHILARGEAIQVERDILIWNNKCYVKAPVVVKSPEDALLLSHRKWYSQFYSENSPTLESTRKNPVSPLSTDW
ncbi:hypothetical protein Ciccas_001206 [Cichlidogyrus casuarinus]|uniref:cholesterol 7-desaturase n=1 Tax=Cichlidogyrus casuarinus TaxID=1844966 RepID=A0ABD2QKQ3_9PLAT